MRRTGTIAAHKAAGSTARPRRRRRLLAAVAAILIVVAGYAIWTNTSAYTPQASTQINATPPRGLGDPPRPRADPPRRPLIRFSPRVVRRGAPPTTALHPDTPPPP